FIDFTFPTEGDALSSGAQYDITWNTNLPSSDYLQLYFSSDGGQSFSFIDDGFQNSGTYPWTAPEVVSDQCILNIRDNNGLFEAFSDTFAIEAGDPVIYLNSPTSANSYFPGNNVFINWTKFNVGTIAIEYDLGDGNGWVNLAQNLTSTSYSWPVTASEISNNVKIRVYDDGGLAADTSDVFTIQERSLTFNTPTANSNPPKEGTLTVDYTANYSQGTWTVSYRQTIDSMWTDISSQPWFFNSFDWTTPAIDGFFQLRAINNFYPDQVFYSDIFGIGDVAPSLTILSPNGGEDLETGTTAYLKWEQANLADTDSLIAAIYNGTEWINILSEVNANIPDSIAFVVPSTAGDDYLARIYSPRTMVSDSSDQTFTVSEAPFISVSTPNGNEVFYEQESLTIDWLGTSSLDAADQLTVAISLDGVSFIDLITDTAADLGGTYSFVLPDTISKQYNNAKVAITRVSDGLSDTSDLPFVINPLAEIAINSPQAGDSIQMLQVFAVQLVHGSASVNEQLQFSYELNDSGLWLPLTTIRRSQLQGDTMATFTTPDIDAADSAKMALRVFNVEKNAADTVENIIVWNDASVVINQPIATDTLRSNQSFAMSVDLTGHSRDRVEIYVSLDSAQTFDRLSFFNAGESNTTYNLNFTVDTQVADTVLAQLVAVNTVRDVSDTVNVLIVQNRLISIVGPAEDTFVEANSSQIIEILQGDHRTNDRLNFYHSLDSGNSWTLFGNPRVYQLDGAENTLLDPWTVPDIGSDTLVDALIAVENEQRIVSDTVRVFIQYQPGLQITQPFEEQLFVTGNQEIRWENGDYTDSDVFTVALSTDAGLNWAESHNGTLSGQQNSYTHDFQNAGQYLIAVTNQTRAVSDTVSFAVCQTCPEIVVNTPAADWTKYEPQTMEWYYPATQPQSTDTLLFYISSNNTDWMLIGERPIGTENTTSQVWTPGDLTAGIYYLRVDNQTTGSTSMSNAFNLVENERYEIVYYEPFDSPNMPVTTGADSVDLAIGTWYRSGVRAPLDSIAYGDIGNAFLFDSDGDYIVSPVLEGVDSISLRHTIALYNSVYFIEVLDDQDNVLLQLGNDDPVWYAASYRFDQPYTGRLKFISRRDTPGYVDDFQAFAIDYSDLPAITLTDVDVIAGIDYGVVPVSTQVTSTMQVTGTNLTDSLLISSDLDEVSFSLNGTDFFDEIQIAPDAAYPVMLTVGFETDRDNGFLFNGTIFYRSVGAQTIEVPVTATATKIRTITLNSPDPDRAELIAGQNANLRWQSRGLTEGESLKISISLDNGATFTALDTILHEIERPFHSILLADTLTQAIENVYFMVCTLTAPVAEGSNLTPFSIAPSHPFGAISLTDGAPYPLDILNFQVLFNEEVFNLAQSDLITNGEVLTLTKSVENPSIWTGTILPADTGVLTIELPAGIAIDNLGNLMRFPSSAQFDIVGIPDVILSSNQIDYGTLFFYRQYVKSYELDIADFPLQGPLNITSSYPVGLSVDSTNWENTLSLPADTDFPTTIYARIDTEADYSPTYDFNLIHQTALATADTLNITAEVVEGPPLISIKTPEGEVFNSMSLINVTWTQYGVLPDQKYISISFDGAQSFAVVDSIVGNESPYTYEFSIPDTITSVHDQVFFRVISATGVGDTTDIASAIIEKDRAIWNGTEWMGGVPPNDGTASVFINGPMSLEAGEVMHIMDLALGENAHFTVSDESTLIVNGDVTNNGEISISSGSSLITYEAGGFTGNPVEINRTSRYAGGKYSLMGIPVQQSADITGATAAGLSYQYDETVPYGEAFGLDRWVNAENEELIPGRGYAMAFQKDFAFTGLPNVGTITYQGTYTEDTNDDFEGWNLVANPYPAAIKIEDFLTQNPNLTGAVYIWDDNGSNEERGSNADYIIANGIAATQNSTAGNGDRYNQYVGTSQGFFIKLLDNSNTAITFTESMRYGGNNSDQNFFRETNDQIPFVRLNLTDEEGLFEQTIIGMVAETTEEVINRQYDASVFDADAENLFYSIKDGEFLAIRGIGTVLSEVSLGFTVTKAGSYRISIDLSDYEGVDLKLVDTYLATETPLSADGYEFYSNEGRFNDRFYLMREGVITHTTLTPERDWYYSANTLYLSADYLTKNAGGSFQVWSLSGRKLKEYTI
ncbi:MAG: hypothetical protein AAFO69_01715, partial [Bacteroidota bacterium]